MFRALFTCKSIYYVRKGSWAFHLNYPQINAVEKSDHMAVMREAILKRFSQLKVKSNFTTKSPESYHTKKGVSQEVITAWWATVAYLTCSRFQSLLNVSFPGPFYVLKIKPAKPVLCGQALLRFSLILFSFSCLGGGYLCRAQKVSEVWLVHKSSW